MLCENKLKSDSAVMQLMHLKFVFGNELLLIMLAVETNVSVPVILLQYCPLFQWDFHSLKAGCIAFQFQSRL